MDLGSLFNSDTIMNAATDMANQMMTATTGLVDKLMSSVMLN